MRDSWFEFIHVTTKPEFCSESRLASSSGDRIYAPRLGGYGTCGRGKPPFTLTFTDTNYISKGYSGIHFYLLQGIIVALEPIQ